MKIVKRQGYRGLFSLIWFLIKANKNAKRYNCEMNYTIKTPFNWFK